MDSGTLVLVKRVLLGLAAIVFLVVVPVRPASAATIQPGDQMWSSIGGCTLGFVLTGGGSTYFLSAAHCVDHVGEPIKLSDSSVVGTVAAKGNGDNSSTDWSLIDVTSRAREVSPDVRGHGAPTGVAFASGSAFGDTIDHSGYGIPWFVSIFTREARFGVLVSQNSGVWTSIGPDTFGDSGGPVLHRSSGGALGLISRLCVGVCTSEGPTIEGILPQLPPGLTLRTS